MSNNIKTFSPKQTKVLNWWTKSSPDSDKTAIICDGAVRSGKTLSLSLSYVLWALRTYKKGTFAMCGKTISGLRRNVIFPIIDILHSYGFITELKISQNIFIVKYKNNYAKFHLFGGKDESSAALIQGITLCGVLFDEVALMPRSFVEQALARCSVTGSKFWFNCNPENPYHWFYQDWIKNHLQKNVLYLHFTMQDNPSLSPEIKRRYESLYSGIFYRRYVKGEWCISTGVVYPMFNKQNIVDHTGSCEKYYISCDYGIVNPCSFGLWGKSGDKYIRLAEYYYDSKITGNTKTDEEHLTAIKQLAYGYDIEAVIVDPSAASFITALRKGTDFNVVSAKNDVIEGIKETASYIKDKKILINKCCTDIIREFALYEWESGGTDKPKKVNDHAMDDLRYFIRYIAVDTSDEDIFAVV